MKWDKNVNFWDVLIAMAALVAKINPVTAAFDLKWTLLLTLTFDLSASSLHSCIFTLLGQKKKESSSNLQTISKQKAEICVPFRPKIHLLFLAKSKGWGDICTNLLPIWIPASKLSKGKCYLCFLLLPWKCEFVFPCCLFSGNMSICSRRVIQCIKVTSW